MWCTRLDSAVGWNPDNAHAYKRDRHNLRAPGVGRLRQAQINTAGQVYTSSLQIMYTHELPTT